LIDTGFSSLITPVSACQPSVKPICAGLPRQSVSAGVGMLAKGSKTFGLRGKSHFATQADVPSSPVNAGRLLSPSL
jgi:hypothetical protein